MDNQSVNHFLLIPLMAQSHLIPFTNMAKVLAHHGQQVTIVMTPLNAARWNSIIDYAVKFDLNINFLTFPFPCEEVALPIGCENIDTLPSLDLADKFRQASCMLQGPLEKWLQESAESLPSCIISSQQFRWTSDVAVKFDIPRVLFHTIACFTILCGHNRGCYRGLEKLLGTGFEPVSLPGLPDEIEFNKAQALLSESEKQRSDDLSNQYYTKIRESERSADGMLLNTFEDMEAEYVKAYKKFIKNLWCIGPLSLINKTPTVHEHECLNWLDSKKPGSVIYVCFGSLFKLSPPQLIELGLGLESSNSPFIWVLKKGDCTPELEEWFKQEKFEERLEAEGMGIIIRGWAPQVEILSHGAIGGFLTHCGWNSTLEAVSAGVPMITWPMVSEQSDNERLIVDVLKVGVKIGIEAAKKDFKELVKREDIKKAIEKLINGEETRKRAKELGEKAKRAVEKGGFSYRNVTSLIQYVNQRVSNSL